MGFFRRKPKEPENYNDPALDDGSWLGAGESRYRTLICNHYGSPDTIASGGDQRASAGDPAAALFFFQKGIDTLHSIYACGFNDTGPSSWSRQPSGRDLAIIDRFLETLRDVRSTRPGAAVKESVTEVSDRLRSISTHFKKYSLDGTPYLSRLDELASIAPDVDVSGVFWT